MYCSTCECEFEGWTGRCPNCKSHLVEEGPPNLESDGENVSYQQLVGAIQDQGGSIEFDLATVEVSKSKATRFPWLGYGYAWAKRMRGVSQGITADFVAIDIGKDRKFAFPYRGLGYAWRKEMEGKLAGHYATLNAKKVTKKRRWGFPYFGYGYAWTETMTGSCGDEIDLELITINVGKNHRIMFPYFGYGYAWVKNAKLKATLVSKMLAEEQERRNLISA